MNSLKNENLFDLNHTVSKDFLNEFKYPWEAISKIKDFIYEIMKSLPENEYYSPKKDVFIAKDATVAETASICAPCIIGHKSEVRHCAYIRGYAIIGDSCVIGNSTEVKNSILFDFASAPHFNYVGDSILGFHSHLGGGAITSNVKNYVSTVSVKFQGEKIDTGLLKFGAAVGDFGEIGCNSVLNPGTVLGKNSTVYPLCSVRGTVEENSIYKSPDCIEKKKQ